MTEYTGKYFTIENSRVFGQSVNVIECVDKAGGGHEGCFRCGKPLRRHWFTVRGVDDVEICNIGAECVKKLT